MDVVHLREDEVEILETKLRDTTTGIIPKLRGDDYIKASELIDWLVSAFPITRIKAEEYGQMLWNRGVFDHIAPHPFRDDDQLFRLKQVENSNRKSVDEQQWNQLKQDAANKDISNADPIAKLHKSIENATKVYQRLLREKNQASSPNTLLGLKLLDQTLNLITSNHKPHQNYGQILGLLQNTTSDENESVYLRQPSDSNLNQNKKPTTTTTSSSTTIPNQDQLDFTSLASNDIDEIITSTERLESSLAEQLNLAHQNTLRILKLLKRTNNNNNNNSIINTLNNNKGGSSLTSSSSTSPSSSAFVTKQPRALSPSIQSSPIANPPPPSNIDESPISLQRQRSSSHFGSLKGIDLTPVSIGSVENKFPKFLISEPKSDSFVFTVNGPSHDLLESAVHSCFNNNFYAKTVSTYPHLPGHPKREGDPICDHYCVQVQSSRIISAVADGCNWGTRPAEAAAKASTAFVDFMSKALSSEIQTVQDAGNHILSSFNYAHNKIIEGKSDIWEAGTTTLLGGVMVELVGGGISNHLGGANNDLSQSSAANQGNGGSSASSILSRSVPAIAIGQKDGSGKGGGAPRDPNSPPSKWGFICASVGDCKAFHYNHTSKKFTDITKNNRGNVDDPKDPGGRLGPYVANGHPDLRNLCLHFMPCNEGDIIILMSDGLHDNLDPQTIGVSPKECLLPHDNWSDMEFEKIQDNKGKYMQEFLKKKLRVAEGEDPICPKMITDKLIEHCVETTRSSREFMVNFPNKPLPDDLKAYPGKMDHTTCVAFRVGKQQF